MIANRIRVKISAGDSVRDAVIEVYIEIRLIRIDLVKLILVI